MIKDYEKFKIPDVNKSEDFTVEVNWNPYDKRVDECKLLRFSFPKGGQVVVRREHLNAILFAIGTSADQRKMIPQVTRRSRWYETVVSVEAKNDIRKGEKVTFPLKLTLPTESEEVISEMKKDVIKRGLTKFIK